MLKFQSPTMRFPVFSGVPRVCFSLRKMLLWFKLVKLLFFKVAFLPMKHLRVHMNSFKRVRVFQIELEFGSVGF